ncbi:hypothetical protein [Nocardia sp. NRRL S-836]|uniref:hypothetical protein n=1 Tax=Nocardia sp. NRRL S-836 TaxID=1519492 RepID=UPI0006B014D3|nr:hypothetical protein [Nocardia sp. NRRL S-836]KOV80840.1 hypothetical protein ADL03_31045 [Nocardia sp. NRRL S-836]
MKAAITVQLDDAVSAALSHLRTGSAGQVSEDLRDAVALAGAVPPEVVACVEAAGEHVAYGELMEARTLLTVAQRLLAQFRHQPTAAQQAQVLLPSQASPPTTPIRV